MKNKTFDRLFAITVSKNYHEELSVMLEHNAKFFDAWFVVSQEDDTKTTNVVSSTNNVHLLYYPLVQSKYKEGDTKSILTNSDLEISIAPYASEEKLKQYERCEHPIFDKGGAILTAQKYHLPKFNPTENDLVILMDSDVVLPTDFLQRLQETEFEKDTLYGTLRRDFLFYSDFKQQLNARPFKQMDVAGFIQISKYNSTKLCKRTMDCDWVDNEYKNQFSHTKLIKEITVSHLGLNGMNWEGKTTDSFIFDDSKEDLVKMCKKLDLPQSQNESNLKQNIRKSLLAIQLENHTWNLNFPNFVIPGFSYTGTTTLRKNLESHYAITFASEENSDINYFYDSRHHPSSWRHDLNWYLKHFQRDGNLWGDFANLSLGAGWRKSIERMKISLVDKLHNNSLQPKFLVVLRNPINRAYYQYKHYMENFPQSYNWNWMLPGKSFNENIMAELDLVKTFKNDDWLYAENLGGLLSGGYYAPILRHFKLELGLTDEFLKILIYDELVENSQDVMSDIYDFLEIDIIDSQFTYEKENDMVIDNEIKIKLYEFYEPLNQQVENEILGRTIDIWKK